MIWLLTIITERIIMYANLLVLFIICDDVNSYALYGCKCYLLTSTSTNLVWQKQCPTAKWHGTNTR